MDKYHRFWMDLDHQVLFSSGFAQSLRQLQECWSASVQGSVRLRTHNERINHVEPLVQAAHTKQLTDVPPVLQRDGIWVSIQQLQEKIKPDKQNKFAVFTLAGEGGNLVGYFSGDLL